MCIKVRILIGGDVISPQEVTAPVGIRYKAFEKEIQRRIQRKFREKSGSILAETFRVWLSLVGVASVSNIL